MSAPDHIGSSILPPNATPLMRAYEASGAALLAQIDLPVADLWSADRCPAHLLGQLAWALSVDEWDDGWPEALKRRMVAASFAVHRHKGTVGAVRRALDALGIGAVIEEWFNADPAEGALPGTFRIDAFANAIIDAGYVVNAGLLALVSRVIDHVKPARAHYSLRVGESPDSAITVRSAVRESQTDIAFHQFAQVVA